MKTNPHKARLKIKTIRKSPQIMTTFSLTGLDLARRFVFPLLVLPLLFATTAGAETIKLSLVILQVIYVKV
jgi:hypothetical protein